MIYEANGVRVNFYENSAKGKTEAEFVKHEKHHGLSEKQLREVYGLLNPKKASRKEGNDSSFSVRKDNP